MSFKISNFFTWKEATYSEMAEERGIVNGCDTQQTKNIMQTALRMDTIRMCIGRPLIVNSWFRSEEVNRLVGGVPTSQHREGFAVDFRCNHHTPKELAKMIRENNLSFDQLIIYPTFIHISFCQYIKDERHQVIIK